MNYNIRTLYSHGRCRTVICLIILLIASCAIAVYGQDAKKGNYGFACLENGELKGVNPDKLYPMHSIMKFPQAIYVAKCLKDNSLSLQDSTLVNKSNLMQDTWSPMLCQIEDKRWFSYSELIGLSLRQSDNNACIGLKGRINSPQDRDRLYES